MPQAQTSFSLPASVEPTGVVATLARRLRLKQSAQRGFSRLYLDTFDWALHGAGRLLTATREGEIVTFRLEGGRRTIECRQQGGSIPRFPSEFPPGPLRDAVSRLATIRCLLPQVGARVEQGVWSVLDRREKTVSRLAIEERTLEDDWRRDETRLPVRMLAIPVKGYDQDLERLVRCLREAVDVEPDVMSEHEELLAAIGRSPGDYSSKPRLALDPSEPAAIATKRILSALLETMAANEAGVREDLDTEFLHDFRVAVRRTRTALGQIREVFPRERIQRFREGFSWLGKATGATRDLDVYLLKMTQYRALLPAAARDDLAPLEEHLVSRQRREQRLLVEALDSDRYRSLMNDWSRFLSADLDAPAADAPSARLQACRVAEREIRRAWSRVLKRGGKIDDSSPDEKLHRLRIDCKKLRYLLEFFRSLAPAGEAKQVIAALKKLQDNLGDFNDYAVQQEMMSTFAEDLAAAGEVPPKTLLAMGRLVERLERGQQTERAKFGKQFRLFSDRRTRRLFERLLRHLVEGHLVESSG